MLELRTVTMLAITCSACVVGEFGDPGVSRTSYLAAIQLGTATEALAADIDATGAIYERLYPTVNIVRFEATTTELEMIVRHSAVLAVEPVTDVDSDNPTPVSLESRSAVGSQVLPWGITRVGGPIVAPHTRSLWIFDSGVDLDHPDLNVDATRSVDVVAQFGGDPDDVDAAHATGVAGVAAAIDNGRDVVGVAAGAPVVSMRVLNASGRGRNDVLIAALDHAAGKADEGDVFNLSLAAPGSSLVLETAVVRVADRGIKVVIAAGNAGLDASNFSPAGIDHPGVYTVSAIDQDGCLATFSNYGGPIDLAAPGRDVVTLRPGGGIAVADGTSFAAPHVAGLLIAGDITSSGELCGDRDDVAEPIAHR